MVIIERMMNNEHNLSSSNNAAGWKNVGKGWKGFQSLSTIMR
jgi:hypothetical protein